MIVVLCLDDHDGMMFNHRRLSLDAAVRKDLIAEASGHTLWMNTYSYQQFDEQIPKVRVEESFLRQAGTDDYCFVEDTIVTNQPLEIEELILYRWNRIYPADLFFEFPNGEESWRLTECSTFTGNSHKQITKEKYQYIAKEG